MSALANTALALGYAFALLFAGACVGVCLGWAI